MDHHLSIYSVPSRPTDSIYLQQQRLRAPFINQAEAISPRVSSGSPAFQPIKTENILPVNFSETKPRFVSDLIHLAIERSFRDNDQSRSMALPLPTENSQNIAAPSCYSERSINSSSSTTPTSSPFPIHPHDIKKEDSVSKPVITDGSKIQNEHLQTENRRKFDSQSPKTHSIVKTEVMTPSTTSNFPTNYSSDSKLEGQEKNSRQLEDSGDNSDHPAKKEKLDNELSVVVSDSKASLAPSPYLSITPPPPPSTTNSPANTSATTTAVTKPMSGVEISLNNPNSENASLSMPLREGFYGQTGRNIDSSEADEPPR